MIDAIEAFDDNGGQGVSCRHPVSDEWAHRKHRATIGVEEAIVPGLIVEARTELNRVSADCSMIGLGVSRRGQRPAYDRTHYQNSSQPISALEHADSPSLPEIGDVLGRITPVLVS